MFKRNNSMLGEVRECLIKAAGRTTHDLGMGRIIGQVLGDVYLTEGDSSLDDIGSNLGLSKAAVSIAARQLENLGLLQKIRKPGDRRRYYRIVEHLGVALRQGILKSAREKISAGGAELDHAEALLCRAENEEDSAEVRFLRSRLNRAREQRRNAARIVNHPVMKILGL